MVLPFRSTYPGWANVAFPLAEGGYGVCGGTLDTSGWQRPALYLFDSLGTTTQVFQYGTPGQTWIGYQGKQALDGGFVICGETSGSGSADAFLLKIDTAGNQQWVYTYGHPTRVDYAVSVDLAPGGGYYIGGTRDTGGSSYDPWVFRVDAYGSQIWSHNYGTTFNELPNAHIQTLVDSSVIFGGGLSVQSDGTNHACLVKVDPSGSVVWSHTYGRLGLSSFFAEKEITPGGDIIAAGVTYGPVYEHGEMIRVNNQGDSLWMRYYHYYDSLWTEGDGEFRDVIPTDDGGFIAVGTTYGTFNPDDPPAPYSQDTWVVKVDSLGCIEPGCDGISMITSQITNMGYALSVFPNPVQDQLHTRIKLPANFKTDGPLVLSVTSLDGKLVRQERVPTSSPEEVILDVSSIAAGTYTVHLSDAHNWIAGKKFIVE